MDDSSQAPRPSADSFDLLRSKVSMGFSSLTGAFSFVMFIGEMWVRGPYAFQTLAFAVMSLMFGGIVLWVRRTKKTDGPTALVLITYLVLFFAIERMNPGVSEGIRVAMFAFPVSAVLLSGVRVGLMLWVAAAIDTATMVSLDGERIEVATRILNAMGAVFVGAILLGLGFIFDRERRKAQALASRREAELLDAVAIAEKAAKARSSFLANMSHEIRTPMNGVLGLSRVLVDEPLEPSQRELAQTILSSGQSLLHILDDILDISKLDAGALAVEPEPTRPGALVGEVARLMRPRAHESGLEIEVEGVVDLPGWLLVDGHRVRQVLTNLIGNAVKFTPEGGITIRVAHSEDRLRVEVADTGIGMSPETKARIFQPFEQADASTARRFGGTGLGLAICQHLCLLMNGWIRVESEEDVGSTFTFEVEAPITAEPAFDPNDDPLDCRALRVLVAEDNRVNQVVVRRLLARLGAEAVVVENGREAVERLSVETFDVVLMDLQMPEVDGIEATRLIRGSGGDQAEIPIFALTASVMTEERSQCEEAGMNGVLTKPVELEVLGRTLHDLRPATSRREPSPHTDGRGDRSDDSRAPEQRYTPTPAAPRSAPRDA